MVDLDEPTGAGSAAEDLDVDQEVRWLGARTKSSCSASLQCPLILAYVVTYASVDAGIQDYFTRLSAPPALTHAPGASVVCADTHANLVSRWAGGHHPVTIAGHQTNHEDGALMMCVADLIVI